MCKCDRMDLRLQKKQQLVQYLVHVHVRPNGFASTKKANLPESTVLYQKLQKPGVAVKFCW
jgi:hypothetical protein